MSLIKKITLLLAIFFVIGCSVTAISATDVDDTINIEENTNNNNLEFDSYATNFTSLQQDINTYDEITLKNNVTMSDAEISSFSDGISITKTITIDGNGYTIDANNNGRIFYVDGGSLTLKNITLTNGNTSSNGGAIYADTATLNITNSNFTGNNATYNGGAIYAKDGSNLTITNSNFKDNTAKDTWYGGGAIHAEYNSNLNITCSNFTSNNATNSGGAIHAEYNSNLNITNSSFTSNNAKYGGAIYAVESNLNIINSGFTGNNATYSGGAIYTSISNLNIITNSSFTGNNAEWAGAIYADGSTLIITNSNFTNNNITGVSTVYQNSILSVFVNNQANATVSPNDNFNLTATLIDDKNNTYYSAGLTYNISNGDNVTADELFNAIANLTTAGSYNITASYNGIYNITNPIVNSVQLCVSGSPIDPSVNVTGGLASGLGYDSVTVTLPSDATGNVTIIINNITKYGTLDNGSITFYFWGVNPGENNLTLSYTGDVKYNPIIEGNYSFIAEKSTPFYIVTGYLNNDSAGGQIIVSGPADYGENVTVLVNGTNYTQPLINGSLVILIDNLTVGTYNVTVIAESTDKYKAYNSSSNWTFDKLNDYYHDVVGTYNSTVVVKLPVDATGDVTLVIGNDTFNATVNGTVIIPTGLELGDYNVTVNYTGNNKYDGLVWNQSISLPEDTELMVDNLTKYYNDTTKQLIAVLTLKGEGLANKTITFFVNGYEYNRTTNEEGIARMNINLIPGSYDVNASYDDGFDVYTVNATVTVLTTINATDLVKVYHNESQFYATFVDNNGSALANTNVTFNIHGVWYTRITDSNGTAKLNINLDAGSYIITAVNPDNNEMKGFNITVLSTIQSNDIVKYFRNGTQYSATFTSINGTILANTTVKFNINGVFYNRTTDSNGTATLNINLQPGNYTLTAINPINNETIGSNITVLPVIVGEDLTKTYAEDKSYEATVLDGEGNPLANQTVKMNIHGVIYTKTTDNNGVARLAIHLDAGSYTITTTWNGTYTSNNIKVNP